MLYRNKERNVKGQKYITRYKKFPTLLAYKIEKQLTWTKKNYHIIVISKRSMDSLYKIKKFSLNPGDPQKLVSNQNVVNARKINARETQCNYSIVLDTNKRNEKFQDLESCSQLRP
jgi:hypothetical protein